VTTEGRLPSPWYQVVGTGEPGNAVAVALPLMGDLALSDPLNR